MEDYNIFAWVAWHLTKFFFLIPWAVSVVCFWFWKYNTKEFQKQEWLHAACTDNFFLSPFRFNIKILNVRLNFKYTFNPRGLLLYVFRSTPVSYLSILILQLNILFADILSLLQLHFLCVPSRQCFSTVLKNDTSRSNWKYHGSYRKYLKVYRFKWYEKKKHCFVLNK